MHARNVFLSVTVTALVVVMVACSRRPAAACDVDTDCVQGSFCRENLCADVSDSGTGEGGAPAVCVSPGSSCTSDNDCCSPPCNSGRCAGTGGSSGRATSGGTAGTSGTSGTSGTTSSGGGCQDVYAICSFDAECCPGLSCDMSGSCR